MEEDKIEEKIQEYKNANYPYNREK